MYYYPYFTTDIKTKQSIKSLLGLGLCDSGLPRWLSSKESRCKSGTTIQVGSIPRSGRSLGGGHGNPLQFSCLENSMVSRAWCRLQSIGSQRVEHNWSILAQRGTACDSKIMFSSASSVPLYMQSKSKQQLGLFRILYKVQKYKDKFSILDHSYPNQYIPTMFFKTTLLYLTLSNNSLKNLIILFPMFIVSKYFPYICFNFKSFSPRNYWVRP